MTTTELVRERKTKSQKRRAPRWRVIFREASQKPAKCHLVILTQIFNLSDREAFERRKEAVETGRSVVYEGVRDIAETKMYMANDEAKRHEAHNTEMDGTLFTLERA